MVPSSLDAEPSKLHRAALHEAVADATGGWFVGGVPGALNTTVNMTVRDVDVVPVAVTPPT